MDGRPLQHALETGGRLRFVAVLADDIAQLIVDVIGQIALQPLNIDIAGAHHGDGVLIIGHGAQELLEGGKIVEQNSGDRLEIDVSRQGVYRVEGWLKCGGEERGWIYSNPIYIR